jgi:hypothetical protein
MVIRGHIEIQLYSYHGGATTPLRFSRENLSTHKVMIPICSEWLL